MKSLPSVCTPRLCGITEATRRAQDAIKVSMKDGLFDVLGPAVGLSNEDKIFHMNSQWKDRFCPLHRGISQRDAVKKSTILTVHAALRILYHDSVLPVLGDHRDPEDYWIPDDDLLIHAAEMTRPVTPTNLMTECVATAFSEVMFRMDRHRVRSAMKEVLAVTSDIHTEDLPANNYLVYHQKRGMHSQTLYAWNLLEEKHDEYLVLFSGDQCVLSFGDDHRAWNEDLAIARGGALTE